MTGSVRAGVSVVAGQHAFIRAVVVRQYQLVYVLVAIAEGTLHSAVGILSRCRKYNF
jgi:hypothetical protein